MRTAIIAAPVLAALAALGLLMFVLAGATGSQTSDELPSDLARSDIPAEYLELYLQAGERYETDWWVLAGIGKVETNHGRSEMPGVTSGVNAYGCCAGPMQFAVGPEDGCRVCVGDTWGAYGVDSNGDGIKDVYDPGDAIPAAARYTKANGAPSEWHRALMRYNQSEAYYHEVMEWAERYRQAAALTPMGAVTPESVVNHPNIHLWHPCQRTDILSGQIDPRLLAVLVAIAQTRQVGIYALKCDHGAYTSSGRLSNHALGRAADISDVEGEVCTGSRSGACGRLAVELARVTGPLHSTSSSTASIRMEPRPGMHLRRRTTAIIFTWPTRVSGSRRRSAYLLCLLHHQASRSGVSGGPGTLALRNRSSIGPMSPRT